MNPLVLTGRRQTLKNQNGLYRLATRTTRKNRKGIQENRISFFEMEQQVYLFLLNLHIFSLKTNEISIKILVHYLVSIFKKIHEMPMQKKTKMSGGDGEDKNQLVERVIMDETIMLLADVYSERMTKENCINALINLSSEGKFTLEEILEILEKKNIKNVYNDLHKNDKKQLAIALSTLNIEYKNKQSHIEGNLSYRDYGTAVKGALAAGGLAYFAAKMVMHLLSLSIDVSLDLTNRATQKMADKIMDKLVSYEVGELADNTVKTATLAVNTVAEGANFGVSFINFGVRTVKSVVSKTGEFFTYEHTDGMEIELPDSLNESSFLYDWNTTDDIIDTVLKYESEHGYNINWPPHSQKIINLYKENPEFSYDLSNEEYTQFAIDVSEKISKIDSFKYIHRIQNQPLYDKMSKAFAETATNAMTNTAIFATDASRFATDVAIPNATRIIDREIHSIPGLVGIGSAAISLFSILFILKKHAIKDRTQLLGINASARDMEMLGIQQKAVNNVFETTGQVASKSLSFVASMGLAAVSKVNINIQKAPSAATIMQGPEPESILPEPESPRQRRSSTAVAPAILPGRGPELIRLPAATASSEKLNLYSKMSPKELEEYKEQAKARDSPPPPPQTKTSPVNKLPPRTLPVAVSIAGNDYTPGSDSDNDWEGGRRTKKRKRNMKNRRKSHRNNNK